MFAMKKRRFHVWHTQKRKPKHPRAPAHQWQFQGRVWQPPHTLRTAPRFISQPSIEFGAPLSPGVAVLLAPCVLFPEPLPESDPL